MPLTLCKGVVGVGESEKTAGSLIARPNGLNMGLSRQALSKNWCNWDSAEMSPCFVGDHYILVILFRVNKSLILCRYLAAFNVEKALDRLGSSGLLTARCVKKNEVAMWGKMITMFGLFLGAAGQYALSVIKAPEGIWVTRPDLPERGYYKDQKHIDLWRRAQKFGHTATFLAFIISIIGVWLT